MKIVSVLLTVIGLLITGFSSLGIFYSIFTAVNAGKNSGAEGIGIVIWGLNTAYKLGFVNLFGLAILFFGVILLIVAMFTGKKQQIAG